MKYQTYAFLIFFSVVISIYTLVNVYIFFKGQNALSLYPVIQKYYTILFWIFAFSYIAGRVLEKIWLSPFSAAFTWIGSFWLAIMLYAFLFSFSADLFKFINWIFHFLPEKGSIQLMQLKFYYFIFSLLVISVVVIAGYFNAVNPRVKKLDLQIDKKTGIEKLKIVAVSDIHLGTVISQSRVEKLVKLINRSNPDLVLFAGDVVDEDVGLVMRTKSAKGFQNIKSRYGVYAILGNHEHIGGADEAVAYLQRYNIVFLRDSMVEIAGSVVLIGREDKDMFRFSGKSRLELYQLMENVNKSKPVILLNHQPFNLQEVVKSGVDLQISGHTHHGQLWPFNYLTSAIFELSWGYKKIKDTHFYVSSGYGTWGPRVRVGNRPEIVEINLSFNK